MLARLAATRCSASAALCLLCLLCQVIEAALDDAGLAKDQVDWLVMHQANMRIMSAAADRLGVPPGEPAGCAASEGG